MYANLKEYMESLSKDKWYYMPLTFDIGGQKLLVTARCDFACVTLFKSDFNTNKPRICIEWSFDTIEIKILGEVGNAYGTIAIYDLIINDIELIKGIIETIESYRRL